MGNTEGELAAHIYGRYGTLLGTPTHWRSSLGQNYTAKYAEYLYIYTAEGQQGNGVKS